MYYDGAYRANNATWHVENSAWKAKQIKSILEVNGFDATDIGEIGCGAGEVLREMHTAFPDIPMTGYEVSPQAFEICGSKSSGNLDFKLFDITKSEKKHNLLLVIDIFEHVEDYICFLRNIKSHADYVVFHIPLDLTVQSLIRATPLAHARRTVGHLHYFTKETAIATLMHCGHQIIDSAYTYLQLESPARSLKIRFAAVPRRLALKLNQDLAVRFLGGCSLIVLAR